MMNLSFRNAAWNAHGSIDCEVQHPQLGWVPYTAIDGSGEVEMQQVYDAAVASGPSDYVPPTDAERRADWRPAAFLTRMDFVIACKRAGILTTDEALAAAKGNWPASFADALADPDVDMDPDEAQIIWAAAGQIERTHPLIAAVQTHRNMTDEEVDALFGYAPAA